MRGALCSSLAGSYLTESLFEQILGRIV